MAANQRRPAGGFDRGPAHGIITLVEFSVFGISGLRGIVGRELVPENVSRVTAAFGALAGPGTVALGRDARPSGAMLAMAAAAGLASVGRDVELLGLCPTPTVLHHVRAQEHVAGIVVTASHNPEQWNGMKFARSGGRFLWPEEHARFRRFIDEGSFSRTDWQTAGRVSEYSGAIEDHVRVIAESELFSAARQRLSRAPLRVGVDAVNGAASEAGLCLVRAFGCEPVALSCDASAGGTFPRRPEPTADNLVALRRLVRAQKLDLGLAFDPDGDRLGCVDENGRAPGEEATICLACEYVLSRRKGPVVVNLSTTRAVDDVCASHRARVLRTPVGEASVVERIVETGAVLGGEGNGGVIVPDLNLTRDGLVGAACVIALIAVTGKPLSGLLAEIPSYHMEKTTVPVDRERFGEARDRLKRAFEECHADERDGLRFDGPDFWVHVRPSNTEPLVRIIAEAREEAAARSVTDRARRAMGGA